MIDAKERAETIWEQLRREGDARRKEYEDMAARGHLGPDAPAPHQSFISKLARDTSGIAVGPQQPPPPPPPPGAGFKRKRKNCFGASLPSVKAERMNLPLMQMDHNHLRPHPPQERQESKGKAEQTR